MMFEYFLLPLMVFVKAILITLAGGVLAGSIWMILPKRIKENFFKF